MEAIHKSSQTQKTNPARGFKKHSVLIVEQDLTLRRAMNASLTALGLEVKDAESGEAGKEILETFNPDILIVDYDFPKGLNTSLIEAYRRRTNPQDGSVIVTTIQRMTERWRNKNDPINVLFKPFDMRLLFRMLKQELEHKAQQS